MSTKLGDLTYRNIYDILYIYMYIQINKTTKLLVRTYVHYHQLIQNNYFNSHIKIKWLHLNKLNIHSLLLFGGKNGFIYIASLHKTSFILI